MKVHYSPLARRDIESIGGYLGERNPSGAANVLTAIHRAVNHIADLPLSARKTTRPDIRVTTLARYPYKIFYKPLPNLVEIVHVRHTARRPWRGADEAS